MSSLPSVQAGGESGSQVCRLVNRISTLLRSVGCPGLQVIVLAATNRASALDDALIRPGRFDRVVYMGAPTRNGRYKVLQASPQGRKSMPSLNTLLQSQGKHSGAAQRA